MHAHLVLIGICAAALAACGSGNDAGNGGAPGVGTGGGDASGGNVATGSAGSSDSSRGGSPSAGGSASATGGATGSFPGGGGAPEEGCKPGATKPADDDCNTCTCSDRQQWACTEKACIGCAPAREPTGNCIQVLVYAKSPADSSCCEYPTPCHAPEGWHTYPSEAECTASQACTKDADCGAGHVCELGTGCEEPKSCIPGCRKDADCGKGRSCDVVACVTCPCPGACIDA